MPELPPNNGFGTLTPLQKDFIEILANLPDKDQFYLAGGTALSEYYPGHLEKKNPPVYSLSRPRKKIQALTTIGLPLRSTVAKNSLMKWNAGL